MPPTYWLLDPVSPTTTLGDAAALFLASRPVRDEVGQPGISAGWASNFCWGLSFLGTLHDGAGRSLADVEVGSLKRSHVIAWLTGISQLPQRSAAFTGLNALKSLIAWCAASDACSISVVAGLSTGYRAAKQPVLSGEQREALRLVLARRRSLTDPSNSDVHVVRITLNTGARCKEIREARVGHFVNGVVPALRQPTSKTGEPRVIVLSPDDVQLIQQHARGRAADDLLFPNPKTGKAWTQWHLQRVLVGAALEAGITHATEIFGSTERRVGTHTLRRSWASEALAAGATRDEIRAGLGHRSESAIQAYVKHEVDPGAVRVAEIMRRREAS